MLHTRKHVTHARICTNAHDIPRSNTWEENEECFQLTQHNPRRRYKTTIVVTEVAPVCTLLQPQMKTPRGKVEYRKENKQIKKGMKGAKQKWIDNQCEEIEHSIATNNTKKAFQLVKTLTEHQQGKVYNLQNKEGKCLTE